MKNISKHFTKPVCVCLLAAVCCALWGSAFPFIKIGYSVFDILSNDWQSQILFAGMRFALAGVLVILFGSAVSKKFLIPHSSAVPKICVLAMFQTVLQYVFFYIGLANATGAKSSVIDSVSVFFAVIISAVVFRHDGLTVKKIIGCIIGFIGVIIINFSAADGFDLNFALNGEGFIVLSALAYAMSSVFIKKFSEREDTVILSGYQFLTGGVIMTAIGLISGGKIGAPTAKGVGLILYLAFVSAAAYTLWGILLKYNDVSRVAVFGFMTPVFGCALSALFLNETLSQSAFQIIISLFCVCLGIFLVNTKDNNVLKGE